MCLVFVLITKVKYTSSSFLSGISVCLFCSSIKKQLLVFITFLLGLKLIFLRQHLKCKQLCLHNKSCIYLAYNSTTGTQSSVDYWKSLNVYQFFKCLHVWSAFSFELLILKTVGKTKFYFRTIYVPICI